MKMQALRNTSGQTIQIEKVSKFKTYIKNPKEDYERAINAYLNSETGKFGRYFALPNALVYRSVITDPRTKEQSIAQDIVAQDLNGRKIGNSSILGYIGRTVSFGRESLNRQVTDVQKAISQHIPMLPFTVFEQADLDITSLEVAGEGPEETFKVKEPNPKYKYGSKLPETIIVDRHFTGVKLFKIEDKLFLFDVDRREIDHKIFNPFLVELKDNTLTTIESAYDSLMPKEVKDALKKGTTVHRQGEWFFIEVKNVSPDVTPDQERPRWGTNPKLENVRLELRAGNNSPNYASECLRDRNLVKGTISHSGREHADLRLKVWCKPIVNTSISSFTITGDVD
jgi:hypothetical protein